MAELIREPRKDSVSLQDWALFLARTTKQGGGFICLEVANINNSEKLEIIAGSRFEINHVFYEVPDNEKVPGQPDSNGQWFLYTRPLGGRAEYLFVKTMPEWSAAKGGWYNGNDRAIVKFYYIIGAKYNNKVILDSYNAMAQQNMSFSIPDTGGMEVTIPGYVSGRPFDSMFDLVEGFYRYEIRGGNPGAGGIGGDGGAGGQPGATKTFNGHYGNAGATGTAGDGGISSSPLNGGFYHKGGSIHIIVGANGGDGGKGGTGGTGSKGPGEGNADGLASYSRGGDGGVGGNGGGAGGGLDSCIENIVVAKGGRRGGTTGNPYDLRQSKAGTIDGFGGDGGQGGIGEQGHSTIDSAGIKHDLTGYGSEGSKGYAGKPPKTTTSGYVRIWRVG